MKTPEMLKARKGSAYLIVLGAVIFVSLFATISAGIISGGVKRMHAYSLQMRAYYLNHSAEETAVAAITDDSNDIIVNRINKLVSSQSMEDSMDHYSGTGEWLGKTQITITKETHEYYEREEYWAVIRTETEIPDDSGNGKLFTYTGSVMVLISNPLVQIYDIAPESFG